MGKAEMAHFTTIQVNYHKTTQPHPAGNNVPTSHITAVGDHPGGQVFVEDGLAMHGPLSVHRHVQDTKPPGCAWQPQRRFCASNAVGLGGFGHFCPA